MKSLKDINNIEDIEKVVIVNNDQDQIFDIIIETKEPFMKPKEGEGWSMNGKSIRHQIPYKVLGLFFIENLTNKQLE